MNIEQERAQFEAWYRLHHGSRNVYGRDASGEYADKQVQGAFNVWQARAALIDLADDIRAALAAQPAINGYTCTVPDDCETLHWRGQILSMNELSSMAQPAVGEEIMVNAAHDVFTLPLQPSGLSSGPRFVVHVPAQPAASAEPVAWVAADTLHSPHPTCVSSLAYMSQLDKDRGREYVPLYAAPLAAEQQPAPDVVELVNDAERWRYVRQFLSLDDVGDEEFCLGLVVDYEGLESAVTPHAARLHAERCAAEWVVDADYVGDISPLPPVTVEQAIDAAMQRTTAQEGSKQ